MGRLVLIVAFVTSSLLLCGPACKKREEKTKVESDPPPGPNTPLRSLDDLMQLLPEGARPEGDTWSRVSRDAANDWLERWIRDRRENGQERTIRLELTVAESPDLSRSEDGPEGGELRYDASVRVFTDRSTFIIGFGQDGQPRQGENYYRKRKVPVLGTERVVREQIGGQGKLYWRGADVQVAKRIERLREGDRLVVDMDIEETTIQEDGTILLKLDESDFTVFEWPDPEPAEDTTRRPTDGGTTD